MQDRIKDSIKLVVKETFDLEVESELSHTEEKFGDYATNVALKLAKDLSKSPLEIAQKIAEKLRKTTTDYIDEVSVAEPGFINLKLKDKNLIESAKKSSTYRPKNYDGQVVIIEYSDPNPFKVLHAGHVYTTIVGDAIARLIELSGAQVHRVNYGGDVGRHVGITMWAIIKYLGGEFPEKLAKVEPSERSVWMSNRYVEGNTAFGDDDKVKSEVTDLNKRIYELHKLNDHDSPFSKIYWECREWSYQAFDKFYAELGSKIEKYYPESSVSEIGLDQVKKHIGTVFEESDGAVIFKGERFGLHTRVFINGEGLPTYEAKEIGLILKKSEDYHPDKSVIITGNEQQEYMAVAIKAIEQFLPDLARSTIYIPHGMVRLQGNVKMSSRLGNIVPANEVMAITSRAMKELGRDEDAEVVLGAVKYSFLKNRIGADIIYDPDESVSLEGNSGPYLQYSYARACSILSKSDLSDKNSHSIADLQVYERSLARKIQQYSEIVDKSVAELMPHHICTYLYELAQTFNSFYEHSRVIGDEREITRIELIRMYSETLKAGLDLLNIGSPEHL